MTATKSGPRASHDPVEVRKLKEELEVLLRPPVKVRLPSHRDALKSKARAAFEAGVAELLVRGWSKRGIARHLGADIHTLEDWLAGNRQVPGWAFAGLSTDGRVAALRDLLGDVEAERYTGTDG